MAAGLRRQSRGVACKVKGFRLDDEQVGTAQLGRGEREVDRLCESSSLRIAVEEHHNRAVGTRLWADEDDRAGGFGGQTAHVGRRRPGTPPDDEQFRDVRHVHENRDHWPSDRRAVRGQLRTPRAGQLDGRGRHVLRRAATCVVRPHQPRPVAVGGCQGAIGVHDVQFVPRATGLIYCPCEHRGVLVARIDADDDRPAHG